MQCAMMRIFTYVLRLRWMVSEGD